MTQVKLILNDKKKEVVFKQPLSFLSCISAFNTNHINFPTPPFRGPGGY